uniref:V-SNARE coiled-coil homology domain-containing protein n=1 Tax=Eptatretus burgeri TaxID=7764 RepID=A0A8C4QLU4_EPTBU
MDQGVTEQKEQSERGGANTPAAEITEELKDIMAKNVEKVLQRENNLENLLMKSENLETSEYCPVNGGDL